MVHIIDGALRPPELPAVRERRYKRRAYAFPPLVALAAALTAWATARFCPGTDPLGAVIWTACWLVAFLWPAASLLAAHIWPNAEGSAWDDNSGCGSTLHPPGMRYYDSVFLAQPTAFFTATAAWFGLWWLALALGIMALAFVVRAVYQVRDDFWLQA